MRDGEKSDRQKMLSRVQRQCGGSPLWSPKQTGLIKVLAILAYKLDFADRLYRPDRHGFRNGFSLLAKRGILQRLRISSRILFISTGLAEALEFPLKPASPARCCRRTAMRRVGRFFPFGRAKPRR
jgi:hypothetical protein